MDICTIESLKNSNPPSPRLILDVNTLYPELINFEANMKNYQTLFDMKCELKKLVAQIREDKKPPRSQHTRAMYEFRCLHIARCLLKGRTLEEIEGSDAVHKKTGNKPDMKRVEALLAKWKPLHEAEVAKMQAAYEASREPALASA